MVEVGYLSLAAIFWLSILHLFWRPRITLGTSETDPVAVPMAVAMEEMWREVVKGSGEIDEMRGVNPEWDFMGRTFFILGEANLALRVPERKQVCLETIDLLLADTLQLEEQEGMGFFLLGYYRDQPWVQQPPRSVFVDGEIALCLGARRLLEEKKEWREEFNERVDLIIERLEKSPTLCAESYPDECWMFCSSVVMATLRMSEVLDGRDHSDLTERWLEIARDRLVDEETGMLISAFQLDGTPHPAGPGPEGSTIWLAAHMLQVVDEGFADEQYRLAREHLGRTLLGFGYSREWPHLQLLAADIDSGPVVPFLGLSASASGLALLGAAAFEDVSFYRKLRASLEFGTFPIEGDEGRSYLMAGAIGNPVIFYSTVEGPLWDLLQPKTDT